MGVSTPSVQFGVPLSFIGDNVYAYGSNCYHMGALIYGFQPQQRGNADPIANHPTDSPS